MDIFSAWLSNITATQFYELIFKVPKSKYISILGILTPERSGNLYALLTHEQARPHAITVNPDHYLSQEEINNPELVTSIDLCEMRTQEIFNVLSAIEAAMKSLKINKNNNVPVLLINIPFSKSEWDSIFFLLDKYYPLICEFIIMKTRARRIRQKTSGKYPTDLGNEIVLITNSRDL